MLSAPWRLLEDARRVSGGVPSAAPDGTVMVATTGATFNPNPPLFPNPRPESKRGPEKEMEETILETFSDVPVLKC
jgi:hypothetical protein